MTEDQYREVSIQFVLPFIFIVVIDIICNIVCVQVMVPVPVPDAYYAWCRYWASRKRQRITDNVEEPILTTSLAVMT